MKYQTRILLVTLMIIGFIPILAIRGSIITDDINSMSESSQKFDPPSLSSEMLFELDPTNPTQILKSQFNEQKENQKDEILTSNLSIDEIKLDSEKYEEVDFWIIEDFTIIPWGQTNHRFNALSSQMSQRRHQMPTKQSNKKSIRFASFHPTYYLYLNIEEKKSKKHF